MNKLIYVVDDDLHIRQLILSFLQKDGFEAVGFGSGETVLQAYELRKPDLVVLDIMLPGIDGLGVLATIRQKYTTPVLLVSAKDSELDRITGITLGGDDYMIKPFSPAELVVRVKALLRRMEMNKEVNKDQSLLTMGDLTVDLNLRMVLHNEQAFSVTPTEFDFLVYMLSNYERAVSKAELLKELWHFEFDVDTRATDDLVKRLRKKLAVQGSTVHIETVWGFGFRIVDGGLETPNE